MTPQTMVLSLVIRQVDADFLDDALAGLHVAGVRLEATVEDFLGIDHDVVDAGHRAGQDADL